VGLRKYGLDRRVRLRQVTAEQTHSRVIISKNDLAALIQARHAAPHSVLGMHRIHAAAARASWCARWSAAPRSAKWSMPFASGKAVPMKRLAPEGLFEVFIPKRKEVFKYQLRIFYPAARAEDFRPILLLPTLGAQDLYLFNEGNEHRIYEKLGAHVRDLGGVAGVSFAVWAPSAARVSVVGNFNQWDGRYHPMRTLGASGVWELFVQGWARRTLQV